MFIFPPNREDPISILFTETSCQLSNFVLVGQPTSEALQHQPYMQKHDLFRKLGYEIKKSKNKKYSTNRSWNT